MKTCSQGSVRRTVSFFSLGSSALFLATSFFNWGLEARMF